MKVIMTGINLPLGNFCFGVGRKAIQNIRVAKEWYCGKAGRKFVVAVNGEFGQRA